MNTAQQKDLDFWKKKIEAENGKLKNSWYTKLFTSQFEIPLGFYANKKVLDVGSGPRGTLEWAEMAKERIGLDRYAECYGELGANKQNMKYVSARAESIPFDDNYFEIVSIFNTIEYINEPLVAIREIQRVLKPGGICLLLCEINPDYQQTKGLNSPKEFGELLSRDWGIIEAQYYEKKSNGFYQCIDDAIPYDFKDCSQRSFIASILFYKPSSVEISAPTRPKISIIIPVKQNVSYLWQAIESILKQTYTDYEILVIDDGVNPRISQRLKPYSNYIKYFKTENLNTAGRLNYGISQAKGELITFLDSNNFWTRENRLKKQVRRFETQSGLGLLHSGWSVIDEQDETILSVEPWHKITQLNLETWLQYQYADLNALMIAREWLQKVKGFEPQLKTFYALDLVLRLSLVGCKSSWLRQITISNRKFITNEEDHTSKTTENIWDMLNSFFERSDIPTKIKQIESNIRYISNVQVAWDSYNRGELSLAVEYLSKSRKFSPYLRIETISDWIDRFAAFSREANSEFDVDSLCDSSEWRNLILV